MELDEDAARGFEEELYWEDSRDRNSKDTGATAFSPRTKPKRAQYNSRI